MKTARKFLVSPTWKLMLIDMGIDPQAVLIYAALPADLFNKEDVWLTPEQYYQLWRGADQAAGNKEVALLLAENFHAESFDAPIFASLCSSNFNSAARRLSHYKPLIGPMILTVEEDSEKTRLQIECYGYENTLPKCLGTSEMVFFTQLIRLATRETIQPLSIQLPELPHNLTPYKEYFACELMQGEKAEICFRAEDANKPFLTSNAAMWDLFEEKLNQRLADLTNDASTSERVRAVLLEALPSGEASIEMVASKLAMSKRTLQRKLTEEAQTFQSLLISVREALADHYLEQSKLSLAEISFLLGFQELNSFIRAFRAWKGVSPGQYRERVG